MRRGGLNRGPVKGSRVSLGIFHRIGNEDSVDHVDDSVGGFDIGFYNLCVIDQDTKCGPLLMLGSGLGLLFAN